MQGLKVFIDHQFFSKEHIQSEVIKKEDGMKLKTWEI